ncbi:MAG TPA: flagellar hook-associated protein FlgL [Herbaspirillum sp.]|jgi:flagellar hook-associated protein 3 FlgL|nr:flagellar hook-associated protein FlgL [Herbaspirillum sp.]
MRVTDNMVYGGSTDAMLNLQSSVAKLQQQVTQGTVLTPADDPVAAARALDLTQAQSVNTQFATNRANANSLLTSNESTISNIVTTITDIKSQVITAGNATYSNQDRQNVANTLKSDMTTLLGYANSTDGLGNYIYAGYKSTTQPFTQDPTTGAVTYHGDQGVQTLQVDTGQTMPVSVSGQALFQGGGADMFNTLNNLITALQTPVTATANATEAAASQVVYNTAFGVAITGLPTPTAAQIAAATAAATPAQTAAATDAATRAQQANDTNYSRTNFTPGSTGALNQALATAGSQMDAAMSNVLAVQSSVGSSVAALSTLDTVGNAQDIQYTSQISTLMGTGMSADMTKTISQLAQQQTLLQAAQKTFSTVTSLSLLNYLK